MRSVMCPGSYSVDSEFERHEVTVAHGGINFEPHTKQGAGHGERLVAWVRPSQPDLCSPTRGDRLAHRRDRRQVV
jgi:hypothetical protein